MRDTIVNMFGIVVVIFIVICLFSISQIGKGPCDEQNGTILDGYAVNFLGTAYVVEICVDGEKTEKQVDNITYNKYLTGEINKIKY